MDWRLCDVCTFLFQQVVATGKYRYDLRIPSIIAILSPWIHTDTVLKELGYYSIMLLNY